MVIIQCLCFYMYNVNIFRIIIHLTGIFGGGSFNQALKSHWFNPDSLSAQKVTVHLATNNLITYFICYSKAWIWISSQKLLMVPTFYTVNVSIMYLTYVALEMISYNCKSYLQHIVRYVNIC